MLAGFIKTMQAEELQNYKNISIFCKIKSKSGEKKHHFKESRMDRISEK